MANWHVTQLCVEASGPNPASGCSGLDSDSQAARQPFLPHQIISALQTPTKRKIQNQPTDRTESLRRLLLLLLLMRPAACGPPCGPLFPSSAEPHFPSLSHLAPLYFSERQPIKKPALLIRKPRNHALLEFPRLQFESQALTCADLDTQTKGITICVVRLNIKRFLKLPSLNSEAFSERVHISQTHLTLFRACGGLLNFLLLAFVKQASSAAAIASGEHVVMQLPHANRPVSA